MFKYLTSRLSKSVTFLWKERSLKQGRKLETRFWSSLTKTNEVNRLLCKKPRIIAHSPTWRLVSWNSMKRVFLTCSKMSSKEKNSQRSITSLKKKRGTMSDLSKVSTKKFLIVSPASMKKERSLEFSGTNGGKNKSTRPCLTGASSSNRPGVLLWTKYNIKIRFVNI